MLGKKGQFFPLSDTAPRKRFPILTITLIVVNVIIFVWSLTDFEFVVSNYGFIPAHFSILNSRSVLTLFTSMFLHGGLDHLFGNMWYLWIFGDNVEDRFGKIKFLFLYFLSGLSAHFFHYITDPASKIPTIGASGAISGILGAYILLFPREKVLSRVGYVFVHIPAYVVIGFWFVIQFIFGTISFLGGIGSGIAFWAHVGGFIFGFILTALLLIMKRI
ncbi:MAG: rhomboid family intramembrane serine protease [Candidatus Aenigmarchaeota archaeon]|nr:rhomboid family intramembrane serine protease [Candidatus Aenigmarchaeota archaeon]